MLERNDSQGKEWQRRLRVIGKLNQKRARVYPTSLLSDSVTTYALVRASLSSLGTMTNSEIKIKTTKNNIKSNAPFARKVHCEIYGHNCLSAHRVWLFFIGKGMPEYAKINETIAENPIIPSLNLFIGYSFIFW